MSGGSMDGVAWLREGAPKPHGPAMADYIETLRRQLAQVRAQGEGWNRVALRVGEAVGTTGPAGYYQFTSEEWCAWVLSQLAQAEERARVLRVENDILKVDFKALATTATNMAERAEKAEGDLKAVGNALMSGKGHLDHFDTNALVKSIQSLWKSDAECRALEDEVKRRSDLLDVFCGLRISELEAEIERLQRRCECPSPTEADLDWMMNALQRYTGAVGDHSDADTIPMEPDRIPESMRRWWRQNVANEAGGALNVREIIEIILTTWESGRAKAGTLAASKPTPTDEPTKEKP